jgi:hypothetical protein
LSGNANPESTGTGDGFGIWLVGEIGFKLGGTEVGIRLEILLGYVASDSTGVFVGH